MGFALLPVDAYLMLSYNDEEELSPQRGEWEARIYPGYQGQMVHPEATLS